MTVKIKRFVSWLLGFKPITEKRLKQAGFIYKDLGNDSPYETWEKHGIVIWNFHNSNIGDYWLVDILDQASIDKEFYLMQELELFFMACGLDMYS